jgi:hypothetical protein
LPYDKTGKARYNKTQTIISQAAFTKIKEYEAIVPYRAEVKYEKDFEATCKDHYRCSCEELAKIALSAKGVYMDLVYYLQLIDSLKDIALELKI